MRFTFNLLTEPWIPCIRHNGSLIELGLRDALVQAHELLELGGESPLVTAALYRLMLAVLHRVFGPPSITAWVTLWKSGRWDERALDAYFDRWQERFDLFHPRRPFYQAPDKRVKPKAINSLMPDVASGNNATLFDHHTDETAVCLSPAQAARILLATQAFGLAGLSGLPQKFTDAPCARGVIFLAQGETIFQTLALNLMCNQENQVMPTRPSDRPAWEMDDPYIPDRQVPQGYLDYLTWHNRRVLLIPDETPQGTLVRQMTVAPGLRLDGNVLDPMKHYYKKGNSLLVLRFNEERALWRDSAALFRRPSDSFRPPMIFRWLAKLSEDKDSPLNRPQTYRCLALGMANNQAKIDFFRSERMPLPLEYFQGDRGDEFIDCLDEALRMAEETGRQLWGATRTLATLILSPGADVPEARQPIREDLDRLTSEWAVERRYWSRLEVPFHQTMVAIPNEPAAALETWRNILLKTAWTAFDEVTAHQEGNTRALKAIVRARNQLAAGLALALPRADVA